MSGQIILRRLVNNIRWHQVRSCSAVVKPTEVKIYPMEQMSVEMKDRHYPVVGERDIVGHGLGNEGNYVDDHEWPCTGVRFKANTPEILAMREKEEADWSNLTVEDKRFLYRASFAHTFEEMLAPTGEVKRQIIIFLFGCLMTQVFLWVQDYIILPRPSAMLNKGGIEAILQTLIRDRRGILSGISSQYDYEKGEYKPGMEPKGTGSLED
ncbi:cytochrome c oxidase subunit 4 isoform 1, mitochondrial-like [Ylistrum balloti]|uniref:cytochrome c oxidase subunit 4 isoform 1, mitochondrial-like n=1 Tax=Ylistrum balloti TaxID=509963 RepID=UPI002905E113|nr:cytochrome c oxidase subunit 4 isoform 1, mitochondrial-like [Ylistrum balloti]